MKSTMMVLVDMGKSHRKVSMTQVLMQVLWMMNHIAMYKCEKNVKSLNFCIRRFYLTPMFMQFMFQILFLIFNASYD